MKFGVRRRDDPHVDLTPMIDVVFQLLLFFMVTTTFVQQSGIEVTLPQSGAEAELKEDTSLRLRITANGSIYEGELALDQGSLRAAMKSRADRDRNTLVVLEADEGVAHGRVVSVMDLARSYGLTKLAIATDVGGAKP